jgi:hypothetical protein
MDLTAGIPLNSCDEDSRPPAIMTLTWVNALMAGNAQLPTRFWIGFGAGEIP